MLICGDDPSQWTLGGYATVLADYALTTMTMMDAAGSQLDGDNDTSALADVQTTRDDVKTQNPRRAVHPLEHVPHVIQRSVVQHNPLVKCIGDEDKLVVVNGHVIRSCESSVAGVRSHHSAVFGDLTQCTVARRDAVTDEVLAAVQLDGVPRLLNDWLQHYLTHTDTRVTAQLNQFTILTQITASDE